MAAAAVPKAWLVRTGASGLHDSYALDHNVVFIGFQEIGDVGGCASRDEVVSMLESAIPDAKRKALLNWGAQMWGFAKRMEIGDLAVLPSKGTGLIAIGRVTSEYRFEPDAHPERRHVRTVEWLRRDLSRANVDQDLLQSLGAFLTVCELRRNGAASRLQVAVETGVDPGIPGDSSTREDVEVADDALVDVPADLVETARDAITALVYKRFPGEGMEILVDAILSADGFVCETHGSGTTKGIDIVAGRGALGLDSPRILVKIKATKEPVGPDVVQQLVESLADFQGADQGLLVAWGGLTRSAKDLASSHRFRMQVWSAKEVVDAMISVYPQLPDRVRSQVPLLQVWVILQDVEKD